MFDFFGKLKDKGRWRIFKLKLIDARLYFVSIFVGLLTGLVAVPYHYLLQFFFNLRHDFFDSHPTCLRNPPAGNKRHFLHQPGYKYKYSPHQQEKRDIPIPLGMRIKEIMANL